MSDLRSKRGFVGVECDFWEFGVIVRHEKWRHDNGLVSTAEASRPFDIPAFVTFRGNGLDQPDDPRATLADAEARVRAKRWIERDGRLNDQWYEIVSALCYGQSFLYLYLTEPNADETRALVSVQHLAFRFVFRGDRVWIDELRPDAAERALVACLPDVSPASGRGVTVATSALAAAGVEAENHQADQGDWIAYELGRAGIRSDDARAVGKLANLADRVTGQFNVGVRGSTGRAQFAPWAITTHHSPSGRVAQIPQPPLGETTLVTPGSNQVIADGLRAYRANLRQLVVDAR